MLSRWFGDLVGVITAVGYLTVVEVAPASGGAHRGHTARPNGHGPLATGWAKGGPKQCEAVGSKEKKEFCFFFSKNFK